MWLLKLAGAQFTIRPDGTWSFKSTPAFHPANAHFTTILDDLHATRVIEEKVIREDSPTDMTIEFTPKYRRRIA